MFLYHHNYLRKNFRIFPKVVLDESIYYNLGNSIQKNGHEIDQIAIGI